MTRSLQIILFIVLPYFSFGQQHPVAFFTKQEAASVKADIPKYPLLKQSFEDLKKEVDPWLNKEVDVPVPKDPAGGYTHDRHKANYMLLFNAGVLYNITNDNKYAVFVKTILNKYAKLNPTLGKHPEATSSSPGHVFWQALNDANWMVYAGLSYDLIYNTLSVAERKFIEEGAFKPEVDYFTNDLKDWFNLLHNHAVWACAGVGIIGIATGNKDYVDMALYGTAKDGKRGFIAQMNNLFSPDGYYTEGPYYTRYAILPYAMFANALNNSKPELKIFQHRDSILYKALNTALQLTNTDGKFFPINDNIKSKDYTSNELVTAISIFWKAYGPQNNWLAVAEKQKEVLLSPGGAQVAAAAEKNPAALFNYKTMERGDGVNGKEGGVSVLRNGEGKNLSSLIFKYASHGLSHGHFDRLNIGFFNKGNEIISGYGSVRFIGVEQKYGGRYLPENDTWAKETISHNTLVIDEQSHFNANEKISQQFYPEKVFGNLQDSNALVVSARELHAYKNVAMQRSLYDLVLPDGHKLIVDFFAANASGTHQYDLPYYYSGDVISTSFSYKTYSTNMTTLGDKNGYQFLWKIAEGKVKDTLAQFTFLNDKSFYTISSLVPDSATIFFTMIGASDPNFNLRHEPAYILRRNAGSTTFVNVLEMHGDYDPRLEFSRNAYSSISSIKIITEDENYRVTEITLNKKILKIAEAKKDFNKSSFHKTAGLSFTGPYTIVFDGKKL